MDYERRAATTACREQSALVEGRFVPIKSTTQKGLMALHCSREGFKEERTALTNRIRSILAEFGLIFGKSPEVLRAALPDVLEDATNDLGGDARLVLQQALEHWRSLEERMQECDRQVSQHVRGCEEARRASRVIGIG